MIQTRLIFARFLRRGRLRRYAVRAAAALILPPLLAWAAFGCAVAWWPYPAGLDRTPAGATFILDRNGIPLAALAATDGQWRMPLRGEQISGHLLTAIVAVEDSRFYAHGGVDWKSAAMAAWQDARGLRIRRGASTIAMQVQRLREPRRRTFFNKFEQAVRAAQLEKRESKQPVLVEYVNRAPFGGNLVGAGAASWRYFGRPCAQLSLGEAALLAGLPQAPNRYRPDRFPLRAQARRDHVLDRMLEMGAIDRAQYAQAKAEPIAAKWRPLPQQRDGFHSPADGAMPLLATLARAHPAGELRTTLDAGITGQVARAAEEYLRRLEPSGVSAAAVVVLDTQSADCLAAVSLGKGARQIDLTRRPRSSGSTLKPLIYAAAFEAGVCTPDSELNDSPAAWAGYEPADYDRQFRGPITAAEALAQSRNIPAMLVLAKLGVEPALGVMDAAGLKTLAHSHRPYGLALAIGGAECSPMELAQAYAMLARGGIAREVRFIREDKADMASGWGRHSCLPESASGGILAPRADSNGFGAQECAHSPIRRQARMPAPPKPMRKVTDRSDFQQVGGRDAMRCLTARACWQTLGALSEADRTGSVCPDAARLFVAWKTGTSSGHRDAWCAAVTQRRTVIVWLGNPGGEGSAALVGAQAAAPLALRLIASLDAGPGEPWPVVNDPPARSTHMASDETARRSPSTSLTIVSPAAGGQFLLDPDGAAQDQRILLKAALHADGPSAGPRTLWWFVDNQPVAVGDAAAQLWWAPTRGRHEVRAVDSRGHAAVAGIFVR